MNKELELSLDILRPLTYVVTEEEDKVIYDIYQKTKKDSQIYIYRTTRGIIPYEEYCKEAETKDISKNTCGFSQALDEIYVAKPTEKRSIFIMLDVEYYLNGSSDSSQTIIRKFKDIILQTHNDQVCLKSMIIISPQLVVPMKLQRYFEVVYYNLPDESEIRQKAESVLADYNSTLETTDKQFKTKVGENFVRGFKGLTFFEMEQLILSSIKRFGGLDLKAVEDYKGSILRKTSLLELIDTNVTFDNVGGMDNLKHWLNVRSGSWTDDGIEQGVPLLKGLMLLGTTGCGKSLVSRAIANLWGLPLVLFNPSKLFSSRVGESEANMMKALKIVESISPCVMLIDEIDKQFSGSQSSTFSDAGTTSRVIGTFLTWYQDSTSPVFLVATCNNIENLPPELISRFDDKFFVPIPSLNERKSIFKIQLNKHKKDWGKLNLNINELAKLSKELTGREIEQVVKSAIHEMYYEGKTSGNKIPLKQEHILKVLNSKVPIIHTMKDEINYLVQWVGWNEDKQEGIRANWASKRSKNGDSVCVDSDIDDMLDSILKSDEDYLDKKKKKK